MGSLCSLFSPRRLLARRKIASVDYRRDGPFAKEAQRYYPGDYYRGGKVDDICVVVVIAVDDSVPAGEA